MTSEDSGSRQADIEAAVAERRHDLVELTRSLVSIPAENPPGAGLLESQRWITQRLADFAVPCEVFDTSRADTDHRTIIGAIGDSGPSVYLHGHYDVVPAFGSHQFEATVRNEAVYGRGAADMKGGLVAMLVAALIHRDLGGGGRVLLVYTPDEESGGADGAERLADLGLIDPADCRGAIIGEPSYPDIWYAARGAFTVQVTVRGHPAHVGLHYTGVNAFEAAHDVISEMRQYAHRVSDRRTDHFIEPEAARSSIMLLGGVSGGGTNFNIVPDSFSFTIDRRPNPDEDYDAAKGELLGLLDSVGARHELSFHILQDVRPSTTPIDAPLMDTLDRNIARFGGRRAARTMCPGCLETRVYTDLGVAAAAYGPGPMSVMHGPAEHVPIANLTEACAVYAGVLGDLLEVHGVNAG